MSYVCNAESCITDLTRKNIDEALADQTICQAKVTYGPFLKKIIAANLPNLTTIVCAGKYAADLLAAFPNLLKLEVTDNAGDYADEVIKHKNLIVLRTRAPLDHRILKQDTSVKYYTCRDGEIDPLEMRTLTNIVILDTSTVRYRHDPTRAKLLLVDEDLARFALEFL